MARGKNKGKPTLANQSDVNEDTKKKKATVEPKPKPKPKPRYKKASA